MNTLQELVLLLKNTKVDVSAHQPNAYWEGYRNGIQRCIDILLKEDEERMIAGNCEQLTQLTEATWDGNLVSKSARDTLEKLGLVQRVEGWNFITAKGIRWLVTHGVLKK